METTRAFIVIAVDRLLNLIKLISFDLVADPTFAGHNIGGNLDVVLGTADFDFGNFQAVTIDAEALCDLRHFAQREPDNDKSGA
jgi:hypothetical protein